MAETEIPTETTTEMTLRIDVPYVVETAYRIEVRCGETTCDVYEHGTRGSGDWAAWVGNGHIIGEGGRRGYTRQQALTDAAEYVREHERSRLAHVELRRALSDSEETP